MEGALLDRDQTIRELEEQRLRENYTSKDLRSELELQKKKLLISQEEVKDIQKENFELRSKNDSNSDVISALNDQIVFLLNFIKFLFNNFIARFTASVKTQDWWGWKW